MNSTEFYLWLNGYLDALEVEGIEKCKIKNIRKKMEQVKRPSNQERVIFGPNTISENKQSSYNATPKIPQTPKY